VPSKTPARVRRAKFGGVRVETVSLAPDSPCENGNAESVRSSFREELVAREDLE
jgi:hypothetical protein